MKKITILVSLALFFSTLFSFSQTKKVLERTTEFLEMVLIPAGTFQMGQEGIATPVHTVNITKAFLMGKYEVTQRQYMLVIHSNPSYFVGNNNNPVESVNWSDAVQFCNELSKEEGLEQCYTLQGSTGYRCDFNKKGYRLPTEAEWEYACRFYTREDYYFGSSEIQLRIYGWYGYNANNTTHNVGTRVPNNFGLYDMYGNVWEWCWDIYGDYVPGAVDDPIGHDSNSYRVIRGGSYLNDATFCRSAYRREYYPTDRHRSIGFRVVRTNTNTKVIDNSLFKINFSISPNPASDNISITFGDELNYDSRVSLCIYNSLGIEIKRFDAGELSGKSSVNFSTEALPSGIYYCTLNSGVNKITKSFAVVR